MNDDKLNSRYAIRVSDEDYLQFINLPMIERRRINEYVRAIWIQRIRFGYEHRITQSDQLSV